MAGSLLFPAAAPSSSSFSSPSRPSHTRREHWCRCLICKTVCAVELVLLIYVNRHTAHRCRGKGKARMGGEDCCCHRRQRRNDLDPPRGCGGNGLKGATRRAVLRVFPPPMSTAVMMVAMVLVGCHSLCCHCWRRRQCGDNTTVTTATTATTMATMACTARAVSTATAMVRDGKCTPPQPPPLSLPTQLLVLACFVILCLLLF
jgi:hypothetical protein